MADGDYISNRADVESVFGTENVKRWADADNTEDDPTIAARIDWANMLAESDFLGRIIEGPYDFEEVRTTKPKLAIVICASLAGAALYDTRRVVDSEEGTDRVAKQRKNADRWVQQIMAGQTKLFDPTTYEPLSKTAQNSPSVADTS